MPRKKSTTSTLETTVQNVLARFAHDIAAAVRSEFASEIERIIGGAGAAPAPRRPGRPAGGGAAAKPADGRRKPHPARSYSDADVTRVLNLIKSRPGLRSEQIQAEIGNKKVVEKVLARLRDAGQVRTTGTRRAMTYSAS
jgi:hypothetical protein